MKKRILSMLIVAVMLISVIPLSAGAKTNYSYYPINYKKWISYSSSGTPILNIEAYNNTNEAIESTVFKVTPKNSYGGGISQYNDGRTWGFDLTVQANGYLEEKYDSAVMDEYLYGYSSATENTLVYLSSVKFKDGTTWYNPGNCYTEANFVILNPKDNSGNYLIDSTHNLFIMQTGCSVYARDWYIWNEGRGWVWFSNDIMPDCTVWASGAGIKLVINNNPNLYKIINFNVKQIPEFQIKSFATNETQMSTKDDVTFYMPYSQKAPYSFGLWDTVAANSRAWYVYDASAGRYVWFSDERGPVCHLWKKGTHKIKLVHDGDQKNYTEFEFVIR